MPDRPATPDAEPGRARRVRIDQGSASGSDLAPGRGSLLRAFALGSRAARPLAAREPDRRAAPRQHVECLAWVGWKGWRRFHMNDALVVNISRGGAQIFLDTPPPCRRPVWVFLETPALNTIVKARVLEVRATRQGQCVIRVAFHEPCPYAVFETAVCGLAPADPKARLAPAPRRVAAG